MRCQIEKIMTGWLVTDRKFNQHHFAEFGLALAFIAAQFQRDVTIDDQTDFKQSVW